METWRRLPKWAQWGIGVFAVLVVIGLLANGEENSGGEKAPTSAARALSPVGEWRQEIRNAASEDAVIECQRQAYCEVSFDMGELSGLFDTDSELMVAQRDVWAALFSNPRLQRGVVEMEAPTESVGGKGLGSNPVLRVRCDRSANELIDWEVVDADGLRELCRWEELIDF